MKIYISRILPARHQKAYAKTRVRVATIRLKTGRKEDLLVERMRFHCIGSTESDEHCILCCELYKDLKYAPFDLIAVHFPAFKC